MRQVPGRQERRRLGERRREREVPRRDHPDPPLPGQEVDLPEILGGEPGAPHHHVGAPTHRRERVRSDRGVGGVLDEDVRALDPLSTEAETGTPMAAPSHTSPRSRPAADRETAETRERSSALRTASATARPTHPVAAMQTRITRESSHRRSVATLRLKAGIPSKVVSPDRRAQAAASTSAKTTLAQPKEVRHGLQIGSRTSSSNGSS